MKNLTLFLLSALLCSSTSLAANKRIYGDVHVKNIEPIENFIWERANKNTPKYPIELARSGIRGCSVLTFDISQSGKTKNVDIISSQPNKHVGKYARKMLKKWKWVPASSSSSEKFATSEKRTLRLDFCMGQSSLEESQQACAQQAKMTCG